MISVGLYCLQCAWRPGLLPCSSNQCQKGCEGSERIRLGDIWATSVLGKGRAQAKALRQVQAKEEREGQWIWNRKQVGREGWNGADRAACGG